MSFKFPKMILKSQTHTHMRRIIILFDCAKLFTAFFMSFRRLKRMAIGPTMLILTYRVY